MVSEEEKIYKSVIYMLKHPELIKKQFPLMIKF